jgi:tetratricopeptide (TPR) repeat protein
LDKVIKKNPQNIQVLMNRGVYKSFLDDYKGAVEDFTKVIEIDTSNELAYLNRGKSNTNLGNYTEAIDDFTKTIKMKGGRETEDGGLWYIKIVKNPLPFINNNNDLAAFDVTMEEICFERGFARYNIGSLRLALNDFYFCVQSNFEPAESYYMLGLIYIAYGNMEEAYLAFNKSRMLGFSDAQEMIDKYYK